MRSCGLLGALVRREMTGCWCPSELGGPRFVAELSEAQAQGHIFLGFLSGGQTVVSFRCILASAEPEPDGDLALAGGAISLEFWRVWPSGRGRLQLSTFRHHDALQGNELLGQFQPRLLFYEFPREARFQAFFVWDLVDRRGRPFWQIRVLAGSLPLASCCACRRGACSEHGLTTLTELRVKSEQCGDVRRCLRPLSASSLLLLRPHKGLVTVVSLGAVRIPRGPAGLSLCVPSFGAPAKLHFGGCTEGVCSLCYQAWCCSFRAGTVSRITEALPVTADTCPLSRPSAAASPQPMQHLACTACHLAEQLALRPACLDIVVNVSGLVDSHDRTDRAADGLTCPQMSAKLLAHSYGHWLRRKCLLKTSKGPLQPALLSRAPSKRTVCSGMPWLLQNSDRCLSYASELCCSRLPSASGDQTEDQEDLDFYDLPLLSAGVHLTHTGPLSAASSLRGPPPSGPAVRIEELVLALRPLLERRFALPPFGPEPEIRVTCATGRRIQLFVCPWQWREGEGVRLDWCLDTGAWRAMREDLKTPPRHDEELAMPGRPGSNATLLPDIGARRLQFFPDVLESAESLPELFDDSGLFSICKGDHSP